MRMKMTRVRKTLARGGLQACDVLGSSRSSTRPWRTHVRLSNRVTRVSFCESYSEHSASGLGHRTPGRSEWVKRDPSHAVGEGAGYVCHKSDRGYLSGHELSKARGEGQGGDEQSHQCWEEQPSRDRGVTASDKRHSP